MTDHDDEDPFGIEQRLEEIAEAQRQVAAADGDIKGPAELGPDDVLTQSFSVYCETCGAEIGGDYDDFYKAAEAQIKHQFKSIPDAAQPDKRKPGRSRTHATRIRIATGREES